MKKSSLLFPLLFSILTHSCNTNNHPGQINECISDNTSLVVTFEREDSVSIDLRPEFDGPWPFYTYYHSPESDFIVHSANGQIIQIFNMKKGLLELTVEPNKNFQLIKDIPYVYVHNLDSIFFFRGTNPKGFLVNKEGDLLNTWDLSDAPVDWGGMDYTLYESSHGFLFEDGKFHLELNTSSFYGINNRVNIMTQAIFDPETGNWDAIYGQLPDFYNTNDRINFVATLTQPDKVISEGRIIISYPLSHEIQVYDKKGNLEETKCAGSRYIERFEDPLFQTTNRDRQAEFVHMNSTPAYLGFYYHKDLKIYTRLVRHKFDMVVNGSFRSPCEVEFSLLVLDQELNVVGEFPLNNHKYDWRFAQASPTGFWLIPICDNWPDEGILKYTTHLALEISSQ